MAKINNTQVIQKLVDELKLYPGKDVIPTELAEKILPVFTINEQEVNVTLDKNIQIKTEDTLNDNDISLYVPAGKKWFLQHGTLKYTSDATVGNRDLQLLIYDGSGDEVFTCVGVNAVSANKTYFAQMIQGAAVAFAVAGLGRREMFPIPKDLVLLEGWRIRFMDVSTVSATDDLSIKLIVDEQDA